MFSRTNLASCDLFTITSLSFTAVCIRRTLEWSLCTKKIQRLKFQLACLRGYRDVNPRKRAGMQGKDSLRDRQGAEDLFQVTAPTGGWVRRHL